MLLPPPRIQCQLSAALSSDILPCFCDLPHSPVPFKVKHVNLPFSFSVGLERRQGMRGKRPLRRGHRSDVVSQDKAIGQLSSIAQ